MGLLIVNAIQRYLRELKEDCIEGNQVDVGWKLHQITGSLSLLERDLREIQSRVAELQDFSADIYRRMMKSIAELEAYDFEKTGLTKDLIECLEGNGWKGLKDSRVSQQPSFAVRAIHELHPDWGVM